MSIVEAEHPAGVPVSVSVDIGGKQIQFETGKLAKLMETRGPEDPGVAARLDVIINVARADVVLVLLIAADMVAKPFFT